MSGERSFLNLFRDSRTPLDSIRNKLVTLIYFVIVQYPSVGTTWYSARDLRLPRRTSGSALSSGFGPGVQIRGGSKSAVTPDFVHLLLILSQADFFYQLHSCVCLCQGAFGWQPMTETSRYILPFSKNISLSCSVCEGVGIVLAMTRVQKSVHVSDKHPLLRLVC